MDAMATKAEIEKAVKRLRNADKEFWRAEQTREQPRLNKAGTAYTIAKIKLYKLFNF